MQITTFVSALVPLEDLLMVQLRRSDNDVVWVQNH